MFQLFNEIHIELTKSSISYSFMEEGIFSLFSIFLNIGAFTNFQPKDP